jgi:SAM-dependent methyltransferase
VPSSHSHNHNLKFAFDSQAERFERAPVQSDPRALEYLVRVSDLPARSRIFDAGCGPGLVSEAFLKAGHSVFGVDLSSEMIARAERRCAQFGDRAQFQERSAFDPSLNAHGPFDAAVSRYVVHHVENPPAFLGRQIELLRSGGILVVCDHLTDPDPVKARHHEEIERARDTTHTRNLTAGELVDLFASLGLVNLSLVEESFTLDYDEWFDRGTHGDTKENVRTKLLDGPAVRGFRPTLQNDGSIQIQGIRVIARGTKA